MQYFVVPSNGGYRVAENDGKNTSLRSPWFETYALAEKWAEKQQRRADMTIAPADYRSDVR